MHYDYTKINNIQLIQRSSDWSFYIKSENLILDNDYTITFDYYTNHNENVGFEWNSDAAFETGTYPLTATNQRKTITLRFYATRTFIDFYFRKTNNDRIVYIENFKIKSSIYKNGYLISNYFY